MGEGRGATHMGGVSKQSEWTSAQQPTQAANNTRTHTHDQRHAHCTVHARATGDARGAQSREQGERHKLTLDKRTAEGSNTHPPDKHIAPEGSEQGHFRTRIAW